MSALPRQKVHLIICGACKCMCAVKRVKENNRPQMCSVHNFICSLVLFKKFHSPLFVDILGMLKKNDEPNWLLEIRRIGTLIFVK